MDDADDAPEERRPAAAKLSTSSSWVTLGFLLGAATVWAYLKNQVPMAPAAPVVLSAWPTPKRLEPAPLTIVEAVFAQYAEHAVWDKNTTEIALWRADTRAFSEFYEVRRIGEEYYFRSIPKLTRLLLSRKPLGNEVPIKFTETEEQYREWFEHDRVERPEPGSLQPTLLGPATVPATDAQPSSPVSPNPK